MARKPLKFCLYMPQLAQEVNHFDKIHIVNLVMNQLIRKIPPSGFAAWPRCQNHLLPNVLPLLYCWSTPPLFGYGGVEGNLKKISKNRYLSVWRVSFTCSSWNRPAMYRGDWGTLL